MRRLIALAVVLCLLVGCTKPTAATPLPTRAELEKTLDVMDRQSILSLMGPPDRVVIPSPQFDGEEMWVYTSPKSQFNGEADKGVVLLLNNADHPFKRATYTP